MTKRYAVWCSIETKSMIDTIKEEEDCLYYDDVLRLLIDNWDANQQQGEQDG